MMRIDIILQVCTQYIQIEMSRLIEEFSQNWSTQQLEEGMSQLTKALEACLMTTAINEQLSSKSFLESLKVLGSKLGMSFKEYRKIQVRLKNGIQVEIRTPYFVKATAKRGRKKKGPNGRGRHLGLQVLGILGQATPGCISFVSQMGLLCPSFAVAQSVLREQGFKIDVKTIRRYCRVLEGVYLRNTL